MRNIDIVAIVNAYTTQKNSGEPGVKLPAKVAWTRRVNMDKLFRAKSIIDEAVKELQSKYADDEHSTEMEDGNGRSVKPEYMQEFVKEQADILTQETEVDIRKVKIEDLGDVELSDADMDTIAFMLEG